ncbi:MAG: hypothetical protein UW41_C0025G0010 [Candidatus Collierbacteria bacterium GW2011_GWC2_44_18]|uniref:Peptidase S74 domain-containing protein n=2 Tax=Microgenomates group TaxID=1794810 RepID=A0A0G1KKR9_9BACT|nr:MAG: hypothetical protein UW41_C0025G0010 [Candidatus Collierbacteria bacterium GW2011_GWC2_44_18]
MVIDTSGNVGIGTTGPLSKLSVGGAGNSNYAIYGSGTNGGVYGISTNNAGVYGSSLNGYGVYVDAGTATYDLYVSGSGYATGSFVSGSSDIKFKKNIINLDNALEKVKQLRPVFFDWRSDEFPERSLEKTRQIGFIAQEVQPILPEVVVTDNKDGTLGLKYDKIVPLVIKAIQEQQVQVVSLQSITTDFISKFKEGLIETKKLIVDGVDILKKLNELSGKVDKQQQTIDNQQQQIEELKQVIQELKK